MRTLGYNQPLYILPFDHRGSFETKMFGWHGDLTRITHEYNPLRCSGVFLAPRATWLTRKSSRLSKRC